MRSCRAGLAVEDVVETGLRTEFITQPLVVLGGVDNAPSCVGVDEDEPLVPRGQLVGIAVPLEESLLYADDFVDERHADLEARRRNLPDRFAQARDDDLFGFLDDVNRKGEANNDHTENDEYQDSCEVHFGTSPWRERSGSSPSRSSSRMTFRPT